MSDAPLGPPPPPEGSSGYPPPPPPAGWLPPPPAGAYQQQGYGYTPGVRPEYAGFWIRFAAALLDGFIIGIPLIIVTFAFVEDGGFATGVGYSPGATIGLNLLGTLVGLVYYAALEGGATGQTLGKKICNIRVVDKTTLQPGIGFGRGVGRYFARWLSQIALYLGYLWMLWDQDKQTWHDKLTNVVVVRANR